MGAKFQRVLIQDKNMDGDATPHAWQAWAYKWAAPSAGRYVVELRSHDAVGGFRLNSGYFDQAVLVEF